MKLRTGFVSNSSSSSFVVLYNPARITEIDDEDIHVIGTEVNEGEDYFKPDEKTKKFLKNFWHVANMEACLTLVHEIASFDGESGTLKEDTFIPKGTKIAGMNRDYYCSEDFDAFKQQYSYYVEHEVGARIAENIWEKFDE